jgi:xanthine phosphoribosyltransferase
MTVKVRIDAGDLCVAMLTIRRAIEAESFLPIAVFAPVRGGLVPGVMLSHTLNVPMFPLSYSLRDFEIKEDIPQSAVDFINKHPYKKVILIDDIVDGGDTMKQLVEVLQQRIPSIELKTAAIVHNTYQTNHTTDFYWWRLDRSSDDRWFEFFWEKPQ